MWDQNGKYKEVVTRRYPQPGDKVFVSAREIPSENLGRPLPSRQRKPHGKVWIETSRPNKHQDDEAGELPGSPTLLTDQWQNDHINADFLLSRREIDTIKRCVSYPAERRNWQAMERLMGRLLREDLHVEVSKDDRGILCGMCIRKGEKRLRFCLEDQSERKLEYRNASHTIGAAGPKRMLMKKVDEKWKRWKSGGGVSAERWRDRLRASYNV